MLRSIIALVGGFAIMTFLLLAFVAVAAWAFPLRDGVPTTTYLIANLTLSALAAIAGGYSTAALAPNRPRAHAIGLAVMILAMSLSQLGHRAAGQPAWYPAALALIGPLFALLGGMLRHPHSTSPVPT